MSEFDESEEIPEPKPRKKTYFEKFVCALSMVLNKPVESLHDKFVVCKQTSYPWYHQKFARVPTIDECLEGDQVCFTEANVQFKRDRLVESQIISILRQRFENCMMYEAPHHMERCVKLLNDYEEASTNWFVKYGDLGGFSSVIDAYMKQKHRMLWERKYGEVGTGMCNIDEENEEEVEGKKELN